jgi:hypothetical protein
MLSQVQKGRENSDNNPSCYPYNWEDFCTGPEGVLSTVLQCTTFLLLLLFLLFFFSLLTNSLEKKIPTKPNCSGLEFFLFSITDSVVSHFLLAHYYYPKALQLHRSVVKQRNYVPIFDHPGSLGHIDMPRQNPRHLQQTTTTTHTHK